MQQLSELDASFLYLETADNAHAYRRCLCV